MARVMARSTRASTAQRRQRAKNGVYRSHRVGPWGWRQCPGCRECGYDGMIKVGTKRSGRRRGRGRSTGRSRRRSRMSPGARVTAWSAVGAVGWVFSTEVLGAIGRAVLVAVVAVVLCLRVLSSFSRRI